MDHQKNGDHDFSKKNFLRKMEDQIYSECSNYIVYELLRLAFPIFLEEKILGFWVQHLGSWSFQKVQNYEKFLDETS